MAKNKILSVLIILSLLMFSLTLTAGQKTVNAKPLVDAVSKRAGSVKSGKLQVPLIFWGGDVATIYAADSGIFKSQGLDVNLFLEDNFQKQVEKCLSGKTPYLRGTMGMINAASEVFKKNGIDLVVVYQMTWSTGGDALVTRKGVKNPKNLKKKTVALQLYGPHMDYLANILRSANVNMSSVNYKWFPELTLPSYDTGSSVVDPVSAFLEDKSIDGVMCIIPDALNLTSGGKVGSGAAGSVKGAKIMLSTKTASRVIADVYAVRSDYLKSNKSKVDSFVKALVKGQEELEKLIDNKNSKQSEYKKLMSHAADIFLGTPQAIPDVEGLLGDCWFVGYDGNEKFFTG
ncbi:MAG: ABC transporter substrate-binding protein, partial [bacterium]|nr:ABC transporter substrate-binding protein [bacterium]